MVIQNQIQLRDCTIRFFDGTKAVLSPASAPANSRLTFTDASVHRGTLVTLVPTTVRVVVAGANTPLSVSVSGRDITINQSTDGSSVATGTAAQILTAYNLVAAATTLATISHFSGSTGAGITAAVAAAPIIAGPKSISIKMGDGDLSWKEMSPREYHNDRDVLDSVNDGDEEPLSLSIDSVYEFLTADTGDTETPEDVLYHEGEGADWVTTDPNTCNPFCIDIEVERDLPCTPVKKEFVMFPMFRWEGENCDPKGKMIKFDGRCNVVNATVTPV